MAINSNIGASFMKFQFTDDEGNVVASFRLNPMDVKLIGRVQKFGDRFAEMSSKIPDSGSVDDFLLINQEVEEQICALLGYDANGSLFGQVSALTVMEDGRFFATHILERVTETIEPEIKKRKMAMAAAVDKHTAKYQ